jgi:hypothetical protein
LISPENLWQGQGSQSGCRAIKLRLDVWLTYCRDAKGSRASRRNHAPESADSSRVTGKATQRADGPIYQTCEGSRQHGLRSDFRKPIWPKCSMLRSRKQRRPRRSNGVDAGRLMQVEGVEIQAAAPTPLNGILRRRCFAARSCTGAQSITRPARSGRRISAAPVFHRVDSSGNDRGSTMPRGSRRWRPSAWLRGLRARTGTTSPLRHRMPRMPGWPFSRPATKSCRPGHPGDDQIPNRDAKWRSSRTHFHQSLGLDPSCRSPTPFASGRKGT